MACSSCVVVVAFFFFPSGGGLDECGCGSGWVL